MNQDSSSLGHDSFLDIVANLVGILIILVVVIGAQAAVVWQNSNEESTELVSEYEKLKDQSLDAGGGFR